MISARDFFKERKLWAAACLADGIPVDSSFVCFSPDNTAAKRYNDFRLVLDHLMFQLDPSIA